MARPSDRLPDWEPRLCAYLGTCAARPFEWGRHDCALFLAGGIEAMTGIDPARKLRGTYGSAKEGRARLKQMGFGSLIELVGQHLPEQPPLQAQPGDAALVDRKALGIVQGSLVYVLRREGLGLVPLSRATQAWEV